MNIEAKDFTIKLTYGELWATAFDIRDALFRTLEIHWVEHQVSWRENEKERIGRLRDMFFALGRPDLMEEFYVKAQDIFNRYNDKK